MNLVTKEGINYKIFLSEKKEGFVFVFYILVLPQMLFEVFLQVYKGKSQIYSLWSYIFIALMIFWHWISELKPV